MKLEEKKVDVEKCEETTKMEKAASNQFVHMLA